MATLVGTEPSSTQSAATSSTGQPQLDFDDGQTAACGLADVNERLACLGARLTSAPLPKLSPRVGELVEKGTEAVLSSREQTEFMEAFGLERHQILEEIRGAGRAPHFAGGGDIHPMVAAGPPIIEMVNAMVNGLHVNCSAAGEGVDEMVTIIRQTKDIHFFLVLPDGVCGHLRIPPAPEGQMWLWNFHALIPHYVMLDTAGIYIHYTIGPKAKKMNFDVKTIPELALSKIPSPLAKLGMRPFGSEYIIEERAGSKVWRAMKILCAFASRTCG